MSKAITRRALLRQAAATTGVVVLMACQPAKPAEKPTAEVVQQPTAAQPAPAGKLVIDFWDPSTPESAWAKSKKAILDDFNAKSEKIQVNMVFKPTTGQTQMSEALLTAIAGGTPPDSAYFDRFIVPTWAAENSLTDLTELANAAGIKAEDYFPFAWKEASGWKGRLWALPHDTDDRAVYINVEKAQKAGLDINNPPKYIDEFDQWAEAMFEYEGPRLITAGFIPWAQQGWIYSYGFSWNGKFFDEEKQQVTANDPRIVAACEWMASYSKKYDIATIDSFSQAFGQEAQEPFVMGQLAMTYDGDWRIASVQERYAPDMEYIVIPMPYPKDGGRVATWAGGWSLVIPRGAKNVDAGWEFISFFTNVDNMVKFCVETSHIPTRTESAKDPRFRENKWHAVFMDLLPIADARPPLPIGQFLWTALAEARDLIVHLTKTPQEALDDVTKRANEEMKKYQS